VIGERKLAGVKIREERSLAEPYQRSLRRRERRYVERWMACVERCYPQANRQTITTAVNVALGALNSVAMWSPDALQGPDAPDVVADVVLRGLNVLGESQAAKSAA
jgi:hypothetical protein